LYIAQNDNAYAFDKFSRVFKMPVLWLCLATGRTLSK
jgi:hypothetical protein